MKKNFALLLILALMMSLISFPAMAENNIKLEINGSIVTPSVAPVIENGTTLVPLRIVSENLGATVDWNGETRQVTINKDDIKIILTIDSVTANVNDMDTTLLLAPKIINSTTMVPIRFVSENLKAFVNWDSASRTVQINENGDFAKPAEPTAPEVTDLTGEWIQAGKSIDETHHMAFITEDAITIYWITDSGDTKSLYWVGTYVAPNKITNDHTWESINDKEQTGSALLASTADTKKFHYDGKQITYEASAMGTTTTVRLERTK